MAAASGSVMFIALEAGIAAWMAPVWEAIDRPRRIVLSPVAEAHLARSGSAPADARIAAEGESVLEAGDTMPAVVVASATGRVSESRAIAAGRAAGRATLQVIDTWGPYRRRFSGEAWPDRIAVIDATARREAESDGVPGSLMVETGQPAWERTVPLPSAPADCVAFASQPIASIYGDVLGYDEHTTWRALLAAARANPNRIRRLIYVPHPAERGADPPTGPRVEIVADGVAALREAGTVVSMFSSLMTDALLAGRRVVSFQPGATAEDLCGLSRNKLVPRVTESSQILGALARDSASCEQLRRHLAGSCRRAVKLIDALAAA